MTDWISPARRHATEEAAAAMENLWRITEVELLAAMDANERSADALERVKAMLPAAPEPTARRARPSLHVADEQPELPASRRPAKRGRGVVAVAEGGE